MQLQPYSFWPSLNFIFPWIILQEAASDVERFANRPNASEILVELPEEHPRGWYQYRMGHGQHRWDTRRGESCGHAAHGVTVIAVRGGLTCGEDYQRNLLAMQVLTELLCRNKISLSIVLFENKVTHVGTAVAVATEHSMTVKVENVHRLEILIFNTIHQSVNSGWSKKLPGEPAWGVFFQCIEHRSRISPRVNEWGVFRTTDNK